MVRRDVVSLCEQKKNTQRRSTSFITSAIAKDDVIVGTDIELVWLFQKKGSLLRLLPADAMFTKNGICGTDGRSCVFETRPTPSTDPYILLEATRTALQYAYMYSTLAKENVNTGMTEEEKTALLYDMAYFSLEERFNVSVGESIGAHVHFGLRSGKEITERKISNIVSCMDALVFPLVKLMEPDRGNYTRTYCGYFGSVSDFRIKEHGFEYRSLPSFISNPEVYLGVFALAKAIAFECLLGGLNKQIISSLSIRKDGVSDEHYLRTAAIKSWMLVQSSLSMYYMYKKEIDRLFVMAIHGEGKAHYSCGMDTFSAWGIGNEMVEFVSSFMEGHNPLHGVPRSGPPIIGYIKEEMAAIYPAEPILTYAVPRD